MNTRNSILLAVAVCVNPLQASASVEADLAALQSIVVVNSELSQISMQCSLIARSHATYYEMYIGAMRRPPPDDKVQSNLTESTNCQMRFAVSLMAGSQRLRAGRAACRPYIATLDGIVDNSIKGFLDAHSSRLTDSPDAASERGKQYLVELNGRFAKLRELATEPCGKRN